MKVQLCCCSQIVGPRGEQPVSNNLCHRACTPWAKEMLPLYLLEGLPANQMWDIEHVPLSVIIM